MKIIFIFSCSGMFRVPGFIDGQKIVGRKTSFSEKPEPTDHVHNRLTFLFRHFHVRKEEHTWNIQTRH